MFLIFHENEKRMRALKIRSKNLLNLKTVVNHLNFILHIRVKTKSCTKFWISCFNLSKTRNGTLLSRIIICYNWLIGYFGCNSERDIFYNGQKYVTKLPLKPHPEFLLDNFSRTWKKTKKLKSRLTSERVMKKYDEILKEYKQYKNNWKRFNWWNYKRTYSSSLSTASFDRW